MDVNEHKRHARPGRRRWSHPDKIIKSKKKSTRTGFEPVRSKTKRLSLASVEYEILGVPVNLSGTLSSICRAAWVMLFRVPTSQFLCCGFHMRRSLFFTRRGMHAFWRAKICVPRRTLCTWHGRCLFPWNAPPASIAGSRKQIFDSSSFGGQTTTYVFHAGAYGIPKSRPRVHGKQTSSHGFLGCLLYTSPSPRD